MDLVTWLEAWPLWARIVGVLAGGWLLGVLVHLVLFRGIGRLARRHLTVFVFDDSLLRHLRSPSRWLLPILFVYLLLPLLSPEIPPSIYQPARSVLYVLLVLALAWLLVRLTHVFRDSVLANFSLEAEDNLEARKVLTQFEILRRIVLFVIAVLTLSAILLHFETFRDIGTGLLASAGVAGIILGLAAQRTLGNLFAGFQIAVTQPIRVDDVVIVEGEWGRIEEITLTYVVVRIWDLRRLIVPISYFLEKPFENWTRTSARLLGTVFLYLDPRVPFEAVRAELERLLEASEHWDGDVCRIHVTGASERTVEVRALMSAANASKAFELRCEVREKLITWLQREHPESLPRLRIEGDLSPRPAGV